MKDVHVVILAAGKGTRMNSKKAKVLQLLAGKAMICHLLDKLLSLGVDKISLVVGYQSDEVRKALQDDYPMLGFFEQKEQLGTAHALNQARDVFSKNGRTLVLLGDCPLLEENTLSQLLQQQGNVLLSSVFVNPHGYGRVLQDDKGNVIKIIEEKDATEKEKSIDLVNTGVMLFNNEDLFQCIDFIKNNNKQEEYYLTDIAEIFYEKNIKMTTVSAHSQEVLGINDRFHLAEAEALLRARAAEDLMRQGATLLDPLRIDVEGSVVVGRDVVIEPNVFFKGNVVLGDGVRIESGARLIDCEIGAESVVLAMSIIEQAQVAEGVQIGPFARIRPKTVVEKEAKIGNFVELKASRIGKGSKVNHLSYVGDAEMGEGVNIGAGTITCNYDGVRKYQTVIEDGCFIGSNTALIAPIRLGKDVLVGAGSVISKDVEAGRLVLTRAPVVEKENRRKKK